MVVYKWTVASPANCNVNLFKAFSLFHIEHLYGTLENSHIWFLSASAEGSCFGWWLSTLWLLEYSLWAI